MLTSGTSAKMSLSFLIFGVSYYRSGTRGLTDLGLYSMVPSDGIVDLWNDEPVFSYCALSAVLVVIGVCVGRGVIPRVRRRTVTPYVATSASVVGSASPRQRDSPPHELQPPRPASCCPWKREFTPYCKNQKCGNIPLT